MNKILYAVYGSNLLKERFLCYIHGGYYMGKNHIGCTDKFPPIHSGTMRLPHRMYFAKSSSRWEDKGVAFLDDRKETDEKYFTQARLWKITDEQFSQIHRQEGKKWYSKILPLGYANEIKIMTITGDHFNERNQPSEHYIDVIRQGLKQTMDWSTDQCNEYLLRFME